VSGLILAARIFAARAFWPPITSPSRYGAGVPSGRNGAGATTGGGGGEVGQPATAATAQPRATVLKLRRKIISSELPTQLCPIKPAPLADGSAPVLRPLLVKPRRGGLH